MLNFNSLNLTNQTVSSSFVNFVQITGSILTNGLGDSFFDVSQSLNYSSSWASQSLSSSRLFGNSPAYASSYIVTGSYTKYITSSYILTNNENGKLIIVNSSINLYVQVPSTLSQGFACSLFQSGSGQIQLTGSGVNIRNRAGLSASYAQYSLISVLQLDTGNYILQGDVG